MLRTDDGRVHEAEFSPDGTRVLTATDGGAYVWTLDAEPLVPITLEGHQLLVNDAHYGPDGRTLVTASSDRTVRVWDADNLVPALVLRGHVDNVFRVEVSNDGNLVASASDDGTVRVWDLRDTPPHTMAKVEGGGPLRALDHGARVATASRDGREHVWNLEVLRAGSRSQPARVYSTPPGIESMAMTLSEDGTLLVTGGADGLVHVFGVDDPERRSVTLPEPFLGSVSRVEFAPGSSKRLTAAGRDGTARVWVTDGSLVEGSPLRTLILKPLGETRRGHAVLGSVLSGDGRHVAVVPRGGDGAVYDLESALAELAPGALGAPEPVSTFTSPFGGSFTLARSVPGGRRFLASSGGDGGINESGTAIYGFDDPSNPRRFGGHSAKVFSAAVSDDGRMIVTGSKDRSARVWRVDAPDDPVILSRHAGIVHGVGFSPDNALVATASSDGNVRIWPATGGDPIMLIGAGARVRRAWFSPDGQFVHSANGEGGIQTWRIGSRFGAEDLVERLWRRTTTCVPVDLEVASVGRTRAEAETIYTNCERSFGRRPLSEAGSLHYNGLTSRLR